MNKLSNLSAIIWLEKAATFNAMEQYENALNSVNESLEIFESEDFEDFEGGLSSSRLRVAKDLQKILIGKLAFNLFNSAVSKKNDNEDYLGAIKDLDKAINLHSEYTAAYQLRGYCLKMLGKYQESLQDINMTINLDPTMSVAYLMRGEISGKVLHQHHDAIRDLTKAIELEPTLSDAYRFRAIAYEELGELQNALNDINQELRLNPDVNNLMHKGSILSQMGNYQLAIEAYSTALSFEPNLDNERKVLIYDVRARAYLALQQIQAGISDFTSLLQIDPSNSEIYLTRGICYKLLKNNQQALMDLTQALTLDHNLTDAYRHRGEIYGLVGEKRSAIQDFEQYIARDPSDPHIYSLLGVISMGVSNEKVLPNLAMAAKLYKAQGDMEKYHEIAQMIAQITER